jgi:hypothetical protein
MASPPIPPLLEHLAARPFSFYPPILNIEHNEWRYRKETWSEILVVNWKTGEDIWIPRRFIGEVSRINDPVLIVGLTRELEYKAGTVWPYHRRILQMPVTAGTRPDNSPAPAAEPVRDTPAPVVGIRLEPSDRRMFKLVAVALSAAIALCVLALNFNRLTDFRRRNIVFTAADQGFLDLSARDTYAAVVDKLGPPAREASQEVGTIHYRTLAYPDRRYTVILMGGDRDSAHYIGAMDDHWRPLHSVDLRSGGTTLSLLRDLKRF